MINSNYSHLVWHTTKTQTSPSTDSIWWEWLSQTQLTQTRPHSSQSYPVELVIHSSQL